MEDDVDVEEEEEEGDGSQLNESSVLFNDDDGTNCDESVTDRSSELGDHRTAV